MKRWITLTSLTNLAIALVATLFALNVGSYLMLRYVYHVNVFSERDMAKARKTFFKDPQVATFPHPYVGLIGFSNHVYTNALSTEPLFDNIHQSRNRHDVKVLILGGSVAAGLSHSNLFGVKLNEYFGTDRFSVYSAAYPGFKQPQQYLKLVYLDLLGFRPDIVINYAGFNEIVFPVIENRPLNNPAIFPRLYSQHLRSANDRSCVETNNRLLKLDSRIPMITLITYFYAKKCDEQINGVGKPWWVDRLDTRGSEEDFANRGFAAWRESSNRLYEFTKTRNIDYLEIIQPNQHYPNSKLWSDEEREVNHASHVISHAVAKYYSLLSKDGLSVENFRDQRGLFRDNDETLYTDACCHLNQKGNEYVIDDILSNFEYVFEKHLGK